MSRVRPTRFVHVVHRTRRFDRMVRWYANAVMRGPCFSAVPIGVEFDAEAWLARKRAGTPLPALRLREVHEPVSPVRGTAID